MFIKYCFYLVNSVNGLRIWINLSRNSGSEEALPEKEGCC